MSAMGLVQGRQVGPFNIRADDPPVFLRRSLTWTSSTDRGSARIREMKAARIVLVAMSWDGCDGMAEEPKTAADAAMSGLRPVYGRVKDINVRAAEKMPEENYAFKPTLEVKTFGQFVGHLADSNMAMCHAALGEG